MLIPALQVFSIGLFLGFSLPCITYCLPVIFSLIPAGNNFKKISLGLLMFFCGRLFAYAILGYLSGISAFLLQNFLGPGVSSYSKLVAGSISIIFGFYVLFHRPGEDKACISYKQKALHNGGLFVFGLTIGISPCPPLVGLLLEITMISKGPLQGLIYGLMFGLGTFSSGLIMATGLLGILHWLPEELLHSRMPKRILRIFYAMLLISFGIYFIIGAKL